MQQKIRNVILHPAAPIWCLLVMSIVAGAILGASI